MIAADNQVTYAGGSIKGKTTKLWSQGKVGLCVAGILEEGIQLKEYVFALYRGEKPEEPNIEETMAYVMDFSTKKPRIFFIGKDCMMLELEDDYMAAGSGGTLALGAMAAGADFKQALAVAHKFDPFTGKGIIYFDGNTLKKA